MRFIRLDSARLELTWNNLRDNADWKKVAPKEVRPSTVFLRRQMDASDFWLSRVKALW